MLSQFIKRLKFTVVIQIIKRQLNFIKKLTTYLKRLEPHLKPKCIQLLILNIGEIIIFIKKNMKKLDSVINMSLIYGNKSEVNNMENMEAQCKIYQFVNTIIKITKREWTN